jgi:hypothetical protein
MKRSLRARAAQAVLACACCALSLAVRAAHLDLNVDLNPAARRLAAVAELIAPADFSFALHASLAVSSATANGRPVPVSSTAAGDRRYWRIAGTAGAKLRIEYGGTLPALDAALDHRAVLTAHPPMASPEGTFLPSGSGWYPQPRGRFSYTVRIALPASQRGLVAGRLIEEKPPAHAAQQYVARFEFAEASEGIDLMAGPYVVHEKLVPREGVAPLRLRTYFYRDLETLAQGYLEDSAGYIERYSRLIGAYPFDGFSIVASPLPTGFGMPGLTYIGARVLKLPFIRGTSLGHEVLHNWWGNGVYVDYARGNWSEGLTTFMADYAYRERESLAGARAMRFGWLRDFAAVPPGRDIALSAFRSRTHGAAAASGYGKAAMVFFMLRDTIGAEAFASGVRRFWETRRFRRSSWHDLQHAFEESSGRPLGAFFEQWVQRAGAPGVTVKEAQARSADGKTTLTLTIEQAAPAFALEVPLAIVARGKTEMRRARVDRERQVVTLELDFVPEGVRVDPDVRVWRALAPAELPPILRQWIVARAPRLVVAAGETGAQRAAESVARQFFETSPRVSDTVAIDDTREPVLLIGLHGDVDAALARLRLPARPAPVASSAGSTQVWTVENGPQSTPVAVISARDADALKAISRPLPHYGGQSYLVFDGPRVIARGVWAAGSPFVPVARVH